MKKLSFILLCVLCFLNGNAQEKKPNFLIIVLDDLGYTDLGCFGSEIRTPNIDKLAKSGTIFTNFHTSSVCAPSRSMLLSGCDNHEAGLGTMEGVYTLPEQKESPQYAGVLSKNVMTIAEVLKSNNYITIMSGKWHLGKKESEWPDKRGFDETFSLLDGGGSHYADKLGLMPRDNPLSYVENGKKVGKLPDDFYSSKNYTDFMLDALQRHKKDNKPFFGYLTYTAPHDPIQVPDAWLDKYKGVYDKGYDELGKSRTKGAIEKGIVNKNAKSTDDHINYEPWDKVPLEKQKFMSRTMEVYAGMVEYVDDQIGRVVSYLEKSGELQNTYIILISDNGANPKPFEEYTFLSENGNMSYLDQFDLSYENIGRKKSFASVDYGFAQATNGPKHYTKYVTGEGGLNTPLIISGPLLKNKNNISEVLLTSMDIKPTIMDLSGSKQPGNFNGNKITAIRGNSFKNVLEGKAASAHPKDYVLAHFMMGSRYVRKGDYKLLAVGEGAQKGGDKWKLYNLKDDPSETTDLSEKFPDIYKDLLSEWAKYKKEVGIIDSM